jgi:hypothetical protein
VCGKIIFAKNSLLMNFLQVFVNMLKKIFVFIAVSCTLFFTMYSQNLDTLRGQLHAVEVKAKYNPAIPIIKKAIQNRSENAQFANEHYTHTSYQKMVFTADIDRDSMLVKNALQFSETLAAGSASLSKKDSNYLKFMDFFENNYLFFMESVTKNYFKKPATTYEKVIAHRTAGLKDPIASIYLAKLQTINFYYKDFLEIFEANYINPVSKGALAIYYFHLEEKIFRESDTLFVISFKPQKNTHFKSLTGKMWITSQNYAITKIEAAPYDKALGFSFQLMHEYEKQPNQTYFLKDMSVRVDFFTVSVAPAGYEDTRAKAVLFSEKRITDIDYETRVRNREIGFVDIEEDLEDEKMQEKLLATYRTSDLTNKELNTVHLIDSLSKDYKLDKRLESLKIWITGRVPVYFVNIDVMQILHFNATENVRLGLGVYTNDRVSKVVNFGGFFGYGFKDKTWKWGAEVGFNVIKTRDFKITLQCYSDLIESGGVNFFDRDYTLFSGEFYRSWLFKWMYRKDVLGITLQSKLARWLTGYFSTAYSMNMTLFDYSFQQPFADEIPKLYTFHDYFVKAGIRFAFQERFWGAGSYYFHSVSPYPVVTLQYTKGIKDVVHSGFNYNRVDFKLLYRKDWKFLGFTNLTVLAGLIDRSLPYPLLLNQRAGFYHIGMYGADQFGAMRADEFLSDKYMSVFIRHNFGRMTQNKKFSPRIVFCQGIGFGALKDVNAHYGIDLKTMEKGYFESGLMINDLLVIKGLLSFGVGVFARYGAYYLPKPDYKTIDNFAFKVHVRVPFER